MVSWKFEMSRFELYAQKTKQVFTSSMIYQSCRKLKIYCDFFVLDRCGKRGRFRSNFAAICTMAIFRGFQKYLIFLFIVKS